MFTAILMLCVQAYCGQRCDVFLNVPTISRWQWHPFSVANAVGYSLTLNIKRYGAFTEALMDTLQSGDARWHFQALTLLSLSQSSCHRLCKVGQLGLWQWL